MINTQNQTYQKGRGAQYNPKNRFNQHQYESDSEYLQHLYVIKENNQAPKTQYIEVAPKTIVNKVNSPDLGFSYSMNPYQGCEHGCVYCFARTTHEFWGYSAGIDFENKILVKKDAPKLLEKQFKSKKWKVLPIMLSGNTDCYQPIEKQYGITREVLKMCLKYQHPVSIITKNHLIQRDLDIIKKLNEKGLVSITLSITTLSESLKNKLEPRTSSVKNKLNTIAYFSQENIPVNIMVAPIIPALNESEIFDIVKKVAELGAQSVNYSLVRLNGEIGNIFKDWVSKNFPDKALKVIHQIESSHGGKLNDSRFGVRQSGEGKFAENIKKVFEMARRRYLPKVKTKTLNTSLFKPHFNNQLSLF